MRTAIRSSALSGLACGLVRALPVLLAVAAVVVPSQPSPAIASGDKSIAAPDTAGNVGRYTSLALDATGSPVVSYFDLTNGDLKVMHCNDPDCAGGDESVASPDTTGWTGQHTSLALDAAGNPVVSYFEFLDFSNGNLKVLHCNDPDCSGEDESVTSPDVTANTGKWSSLLLDAAGNPVISYNDETNEDLKVMHCNDPNCSGGDESITSPDTAGLVGRYTSLVLDGSDYPVVSYFDGDFSYDLKVLHCNDANCAGGDETITSPDTAGAVGSNTSIALDAAGNPVVSYFDATSGLDNLRLMHCNDPNCNSGDESIVALDTRGVTGYYTSLALDSAGYPVISYYDWTNEDLKVLHCNDPNCLGDDESITSPDTGGTVGGFTSLALDVNGNPVVSYWDETNADLKVLHCRDAYCKAPQAAPTPTATAPAPAPTTTALPTSMPTFLPPTLMPTLRSPTSSPTPRPVDGVVALPDTGGGPHGGTRQPGFIAALAAATAGAFALGGAARRAGRPRPQR